MLWLMGVAASCARLSRYSDPAHVTEDLASIYRMSPAVATDQRFAEPDSLMMAIVDYARQTHELTSEY